MVCTVGKWHKMKELCESVVVSFPSSLVGFVSTYMHLPFLLYCHLGMGRKVGGKAEGKMHGS